MASIIKGQIIKHLSKFAKNLSQDRIRLSMLKGEGKMTDLEMDEKVLMEVLEFPSWLVLNRVVCNKVSVKIPWTKLKTNPICIYLDQVELEMASCRTLRETSDYLQDWKMQMGAGRYGFAEKVVDGMYLHINSITGTLKSDTFHINLQVAQLIVQSLTPNWKSADLRYTRIKDPNRELILTFKEVEWSTVRLTLDAIEINPDRPTTPIRLITNQGKVRITIKKREADCSLVSSKLQMILDDILWVLTDSQTKAVILHIRSLIPVIEKAANLSKARAADNGEPAASSTSFHEDPASRAPHNIKTQKELQNLQFFEKYDVQETSYHLFTRRIDLHLCDEMNQPEKETFKRRVENGAMQIGLYGFSLDYYPFHTASSNREHWQFYDDAMRTSDKWIHTLLAHLKQQYKYAADHIAKQAALKGQNKVGDQSSNKESKSSPPPRPSVGPNAKTKTHQQVQPEDRPGKRSSGTQQATKVDQTSKAGHQPPGRQNSRVKLMSHSMVVRLRDFKFHNVAAGKVAVGQHTKSSNFLLQSDKKTFFLPSEMPSVHVEYTSFYFPDELSFPVPSPVVYVQVNPVQFRLDYTTILWLNQFSFNILQTLPDVDEYYQGMVSEGRDHIDIRVDALMPKIILPAEVPVLGQPDRPPELHIQMSQITTTNSRIGTNSTRPELSQALQDLHTRKLFLGNTSFPGSSGDFKALPKLFWDHAYQPNFILPKECEAENPVANGTLPNQTVSEHAKPTAGSGISQLTTYVFRPDAVDDVWNIKVEQVWADFQGVPSCLDRPVPLVDPIPLNLWLCWPNKRKNSFSHARTRHSIGNSQSEVGSQKATETKHEPVVDEPLLISRNSSQSPSRTAAAHKVLGRVSTNPNVADETEQLKASLNANPRSPFASDSLFKEEDAPTSNSTKISTQSSNCSRLTSNPGQDGSAEAHMADIHIIAHTRSKISLVVNHYQMLFLLRLQQSVQTLMEALQADQSMFASKDRPVSVISQTVAFECPDIEASIVLPPIPGDEDESETKEEGGMAESSNGGTSVSLSETGSTGDTGVPEVTPAEESSKGKPIADKDSLSGRPASRSISDKGSPDSDIPTVEISGSSPVKEIRADSLSSADTGIQGSENNSGDLSVGSAPCASMASETNSVGASSLTHLRQPSDGSTSIVTAKQQPRRKSQEIQLPSPHSASGSPVFKGTDSATNPPRSASQSDLARMPHNQLSLSLLQQTESSSSKVGSLSSLDGSVDMDILSLSSDSSDGFVMATKVDRQSVSSGHGTETESDAGQDPSKTSAVSTEETLETPEDDYRNNKFKLKKVSVVTFHLVGVHAGVEVIGSDIMVKAYAGHLEREEKGNTDYKAFMSTVVTGDRSKGSKLEEKELDTIGNVPVLLLRFQSGPKAEILIPGGGDRGFLQVEVCGLATTFRMSTLTHFASFLTDEVIGDALPMSIRVFDSAVELMDDTPPIFPTHPGPHPMCLSLSNLHVCRTSDGVFHIEGANKEPEAKPSPVSTALEDKTPTASPAQLEEENQQLEAQIQRMKKAMDLLEKERTSLLGTLETLQEEMLTVDRERDLLRSSVLELTRGRSSTK